MDVELRIGYPSEPIEFEAMDGKCGHCGGLVKMPRDPETMHLQPDKCWCLLCGQRYYVETDDIQKWELQQALQKIPHDRLKK